LDGRQFDRSVNYAVVRILDSRNKERPASDEQGDVGSTAGGRFPKRPIVVIDPRAGHGPGIGGSKLDSQIGVAIDAGPPVYFILFFTDPEPGQTIADVQAAEVRFLEEVARRHKDAGKPAVIGNCQAGWAAALIGADRPDVVGPMVFNGSPLSYWGGVDGANPMRYKGGLLGGIWLTSLFCDLGNGRFDGANLVAGFEDLNPANTWWTKQYNVYAGVDTEESRYLNFEKWWGGFFKMNAEEIHFIVESLFVGNELEQGYLQLQEGKPIHLKNFKEPIVVFASKGDNITPPQQALNWLFKVYGSEQEIKRNGQVIVYTIHERIGHLGIFVSSSVARREHAEIINSVETIGYLAPGLYEMVIEGEPSKPWLNDHRVTFVERDMEDLLRLDDDLEDENAFRPVAAISRFNDTLYRAFVSPWVRAAVDESAAEVIRQLHPLRVQRYWFSDLNPLLSPLAFWAPWVKHNRVQATMDNPLKHWERACAGGIRIGLDLFRDMRDLTQEHLFRAVYDNIWMKSLFAEPIRAGQIGIFQKDDELNAIQEELWRKAMEKGGFTEAVVRIVVAMMGVNRVWDRNQFRITAKIIRVNDRLKTVSPADLKRMVKEQAAFLLRNREQALTSLKTLLPDRDDRVEVLEIAASVAAADHELDEKETALLDKVRTILELP
ncbi:MAG TPA: DUF3141 domain-containing protein, partial [Desulfosarcina sp.]|nr:DUF3141 domain-containing protein [Desulfosarcina sp.]